MEQVKNTPAAAIPTKADMKAKLNDFLNKPKVSLALSIGTTIIVGVGSALVAGRMGKSDGYAKGIKDGYDGALLDIGATRSDIPDLANVMAESRAQAAALLASSQNLPATV